MKKFVKLIVVFVATLFLLASCNKYVCPAYTSNDSVTDTEINS